MEDNQDRDRLTERELMLLHDIEAQLRQDARLARAFATRRAVWLRVPNVDLRSGWGGLVAAVSRLARAAVGTRSGPVSWSERHRPERLG
ncbi:MAG: hypothetical protein IPK24_06815 [Kineosporiaceae bacterium]|nr:hypothetical protein [Kineosporiaceae bacterium]MBK8075269.1 hypothetical protein [Kineosporiaceae bacterium]